MAVDLGVLAAPSPSRLVACHRRVRAAERARGAAHASVVAILRSLIHGPARRRTRRLAFSPGPLRWIEPRIARPREVVGLMTRTCLRVTERHRSNARVRERSHLLAGSIAL